MAKSLFNDDCDAPPVPALAPQSRPLQPAQRAPVQPAPPTPVQPAPPPPVQSARPMPLRAAQPRFVPPLARTGPVRPPQPSTEAPPPPSSEQLVKDQFRVRFRRQMLLTAIMLPAAVAAKLDSRDIESPLELAALTVALVGVILTLINWRCPSCNRYLYRRIYPSRCPRCRVTFHD
ncbi:MAG: hypothetical protein LC659_10275 [Myxococcales bacterium]|nr:hypothetical protein [Myxococcales bacterium]